MSELSKRARLLLAEYDLLPYKWVRLAQPLLAEMADELDAKEVKEAPKGLSCGAGKDFY